MDAQFYQWIREATDEQLQQLLSALNLELQSRQAHRASREQDLRGPMVRQWQRCPVRCVQHCAANVNSDAVSVHLIPMISLPTIKQGITAAVTIGAVKQPGNLYIPLPVHISEVYSVSQVPALSEAFYCTFAQAVSKTRCARSNLYAPCPTQQSSAIMFILILYRLWK